ncbi:transglutaminase-like domain-containing protein [Ottowia testudinis]|uniref:transglutaminase-like domain-containing protein n=1 Tax=Ottowia testudinis TaxID=2816950 RepID=UPI001FB05BF1|nr:transglutaminase-like domain-containing protein [Ottowia testudinis]
MAIHNWVRNTIDWQPTWGALQNADSVLASQRGNAHDIASLTVALLRASKIPARYQWGTIELPAPAVMNWVGGVTKPEAALNLLYQGGIAAGAPPAPGAWPASAWNTSGSTPTSTTPPAGEPWMAAQN